jgi:hypothetical protein
MNDFLNKNFLKLITEHQQLNTYIVETSLYTTWELGPKEAAFPFLKKCCTALSSIHLYFISPFVASQNSKNKFFCFPPSLFIFKLTYGKTFCIILFAYQLPLPLIH